MLSGAGSGEFACRPDYLLPLEFVPDVSAIATGSRPTGMGLPRVPVAIWIGVTVPGPEPGESATYAVVPSGVIAMAEGLSPALTAVLGLPGSGPDRRHGPGRVGGDR